MSKTLDYREAMQAYLDGKDLEVNTYGALAVDWEDVFTGNPTSVCFNKTYNYRLKPLRKTLWIAAWSDTSRLTNVYSVANPWGDNGAVSPLWVENLPHRFIEE